MSERLKTASCCRRAAASHASLWRVTNNARMYVTTAITSEPIVLMLTKEYNVLHFECTNCCILFPQGIEGKRASFYEMNTTRHLPLTSQCCL
jgi:hypothetical protein